MKVIIDSIDVDIRTALMCVAECVRAGIEDCVWTFTDKATGSQIIVYDRKNKNSTTYKVYYDKEIEN